MTRATRCRDGLGPHDGRRAARRAGPAAFTRGESRDRSRLKYPKPPFGGSRNRGRASPARWIPCPITARRAIAARAGWPGRKALITGGEFGHGPGRGDRLCARGRRRGDQLLPDEEPDAQEVIELIKAEKRIGLRFPATCATKRSARSRGEGGAGAGRSRHRREQRRPPADASLDPRYHRRGVRLDDEDEHLRAVLDHQGRAAAPEAGLGDHRHDVRAGLRSVAGTLRLCADQGRDDELREVAGQAARARRAFA